MKKSTYIFLALSGFMFASCENSENKNVKTTQEASTQQQELSSKERDFIMEASKSNMLEVELGQLANQKAMNKNVKEFGNHMMSQHDKANTKLLKIAQKKMITLPDSLTEDGMDKKQDLAKLNGKDFDKKYIKEMVDMHKKDVKKFEEMAKEAKDPEVKSFAQQTLPALQTHYMEAQSLDSMITAQEKKKKSNKATSMKK